MKFIYASFKNYIGFYNGLGLNEVTIDFSKCRHKMILITGKNGSGKSTLMKALNILPDNSSDYIPGLPAEKELHIQDGENLYILKITSPISNQGKRGVTKAYINKNGLELNPNGNISSYKENIFAEFELDSNYITLSRLSGEDKGLADKTPGERKKYVSSIVDSLDTYNAINKNLTKKSNIFKSHINTISSKIKNIGDEANIRNTLSSLENRYKNLKDIKSKLETKLIEEESFIKIVDPDGSIQERYNYIYDEVNKCNSELSNIDSSIKKILSVLNIDEEKVVSEYDNTMKNIIKLESSIENSNNKLSDIILKREEDLHVFDIKKQKIDSIKSDQDIDKLRNIVQVLRNNIKTQEKIFKDANITNLDTSKEEYLYIFSSLRKIKDQINIFRNSKNITLIQDTIDNISNTNIDNDIAELDNNRKDLEYELLSIKDNISKLNNDIKTISVLSRRPDKCKIDSCPLISNALEISRQNPAKELDRISSRKIDIENKLEDTNKRLDYLFTLKDSIKELEQILVLIDSNELLYKVDNISYVFTNKEELFKRICNMNPFNEIEDNEKYVDIANNIEVYKTNKSKLIQLEADLSILENKNSMIEELVDELESIQSKINNLDEEVTLLNKDIKFNTEILNKQKAYIDKLSKIKEMIDTKKEVLSIKETRMSEYREIKSNLDKIKIYIDEINNISSELDKLDVELEPMEEQKKMLEHSLITLEEYKQEYDLYAEKYNITNKLKKYSSPTEDGIQTLFMNIYMSKTLNMCNEILSLLFNGSYTLLPYVINSDEFRIPFIGEGLEVDDIHSGSASQIAMIGMIINLVLLSQASTRFNIAFLDELDGPLDNYNRYQFVEVIYKLIDMLQIDQLVMISHSIELEMSNVDVIKLKGYNNEEDKYTGANVIFNYEEVLNN